MTLDPKTVELIRTSLEAGTCHKCQAPSERFHRGLRYCQVCFLRKYGSGVGPQNLYVRAMRLP